MLDLLGCGYVIEHCVSAYAYQQRCEAYQCYIADCLKVIVECRGGKVARRFYDMLHPPKVDSRSAQEIVDDVVKRAGIKVVKRE